MPLADILVARRLCYFLFWIELRMHISQVQIQFPSMPVAVGSRLHKALTFSKERLLIQLSCVDSQELD
jgi:hypothetical protein